MNICVILAHSPDQLCYGNFVKLNRIKTVLQINQINPLGTKSRASYSFSLHITWGLYLCKNAGLKPIN